MTVAALEESAIVQTVGNPGVPGRGAGVQEGLLEITSSTIAQNADDGIAVLTGGRAQLSGNTIQGNGGFGIFADPAGLVSCPATNSFLDNGQNRSEGVPETCEG